MDTILVKCPHCKEQMQAPKGRDSIICMFCGKDVDLKEAANSALNDTSSIEKCFENLNKVMEGADKALENYSVLVRAFKRDSYHELFEQYKADNYGFFTAIKISLANASDENIDGVYHQIARAFILSHENELSGIKKKNDKFSAQMDKNMFMAIFVIPAIKEIGNQKADTLAEEICKEWGASFKDSNILASDYDSICEGFKRKLCYVTTAVCQNLNFGEDCEALNLIKDFRDNYLASTQEGKELIDSYYDIAPTLVKRIDKDASAEEKYVWLWNQYLRHCVEYIKKGQNEACREKYCEMVETLKDEYIRSK